MRSTAQKPGSKDHVRFALDQWEKKSFQVLGIIFQVRILYGDVITCCFPEAGAKRCPFAPGYFIDMFFLL